MAAFLFCVSFVLYGLQGLRATGKEDEAVPSENASDCVQLPEMRATSEDRQASR